MKRTRTGKNRILVWLLSAIVVTCTIMALIVPAMTLDQEKAAQQGGIDVVQEQETVDTDTQSTAPADADTVSDGDASDTDKSQKDAEALDEETAPADNDTINDTIAEAGELAFEGEGFNVSAAYDAKAGLPLDTELAVSEIGEDAEDYEALRDQAIEAVQKEMGGASDADPQLVRLYDISLMAGGAAVEPQTPVDVVISYEKALKISDAQNLRVVHFAVNKKGKVKPEVMDTEDVEVALGKHGGKGAARMKGATFTAQSFSVYAIVDAPEEIYHGGGDHTIQSIEDIKTLGAKGFYVSNKNYYFTGELVHNVSGNSDRDGLKTTSVTYNTVPTDAVKFYFEQVPDTNNQFKIYTITNDQRNYVKMTAVSGNASRAGLTMTQNQNEGTPFKIEAKNNNTFTVSGVVGSTTFYWNRNTRDPGSGAIAGYNSASDHNIATIKLTYREEAVQDPYKLDGKTYGIAYHNDGAAAAAMMAEQKDEKHLVAESMLMRPDVLDNDGILLVAENSDIDEWTFESIREDFYYITTTVGGQKKYLTLNGQKLTLEDEPDSTYSVIKATPGTEENSGKYSFSVGNNKIAINLNGNDTSKGFWGTTGTGSTRWLNLVERSVLNDDDFTLYSAKKVSVSDEEQVKDGQKVIIYTRVWNDTKKRYEFFAVDHDGSLIPCYDVGDNIEWIGSKINTALWDFTEYFNADGTPNYYYELQNDQYGKYIAPQMSGDQILSDSTIGINLNGRRYGESYTTIIAWDDKRYSYSGLKTENGHVVECPLAEAEDFYFAILNPQPAGGSSPDEPGKLSTVNTVDSAQYGIKMNMIDYNNPIRNERDSGQTAVLGRDTNAPGLLETNLGEDGYPMTNPDKTGKVKTSLGDLYQGTTPVNHLFLESIYNESGYFEYDSTQNFAHLNDNGTFTVYDQIGTMNGGDEHKTTRVHGQFMPYDTISEEKGYSIDKNGKVITNQTDVLANELPDTDPRKGEPLYWIGNSIVTAAEHADYFFGMEMEAPFTQTASGLDAWNHDIIFEFSGDDDFWFYVDGELVLDLGGVHSAQVGSVNFRTGEIKSSRGDTTLYEVFRSNYESRGMSEGEINQKLGEIFDTKTVDGKNVHVFKDYSNHTMKVFYMERGAGSSNLHMRFNLAAIRPGTFILSKKLSGTDNPENDLIEFPYQIWYYSKDDGGAKPHLLGAADGEAAGVVYEGGTRKVRYMKEYTPAGGTHSYSHVFFLKPGESAEVQMPDNVQDYFVVECGVNPDVYDHVSVNGDEIAGTSTANMVGDTARCDYKTDRKTLIERSKVDYDNHVSEGAMRTLNITKKLYDSDGTNTLHYDAKAGESEDKTVFNFRLFLGNESTSTDSIPPAYLYHYFVKDRDMNYCRRDSAADRFVPIEIDGSTIKDFSVLNAYLETLSAAEKETIAFKTSMTGSISKIPSDYTVEVRDLIVDTKYKVMERSDEIPKGYTLRLDDGYMRTDEGHELNNHTEPISGVIQVNETPDIQVSNQKGWGLTVEKIWTDKDFIQEHDPIYFAVYQRIENGGETTYTLLENSVRQMKSPDRSIYYFFGNLQGGIPFDHYEVREVTLTEGPDFEVGSDGYVSGYGDLNPIEEGGSLSITGLPVGGSTRYPYTYSVHYEPGQQTTQNENVRSDKVTNSRPGIELYKTDYRVDENGDPVDGEPMEGASFTLIDSDGNNVAASSYTSDANGLITIAYLAEGTYTLTETGTPKGYVGLDKPMKIEITEDHQVSVSGPDSSLYTISTDKMPEMMATITVKNRTSSLQVKKIDADDREPLEGAHFDLYRQVTDAQGNKRKDYNPMEGYKDLVTDKYGILPKVTMNLNPGTYYLTETHAPEEYALLQEDLCFTINQNGTVTIETDAFKSWLSSSIDEAGHVSYTIEIPNGQMKNVRIIKVSAGTDVVLQGASFELYRAADYDDLANAPREGAEAVISGTTGQDGILSLGMLPAGDYRLVETEAPAGYNLPEGPVSISVTADAVSAMQAGSPSSVEPLEGDIWQITVWNTAGVELPESGGPGTTLIYLIGSILLLGCGTILVARRRVRRTS